MKIYLVWTHLEYEGWQYLEFKSLKEARDYMKRKNTEIYTPKLTKLLK